MIIEMIDLLNPSKKVLNKKSPSIEGLLLIGFSHLAIPFWKNKFLNDEYSLQSTIQMFSRQK
jgi:hypothetical protein